MRQILPTVIMSLVAVALPPLLTAQQPIPPGQKTLFVVDTSVGINTNQPITTLHVREEDPDKADRVLLRLSGDDFYPLMEYENEMAGKIWRLGLNGSGNFVINQTDDILVAELRVTADGEVFTNGTQVHPDYVFEAGYELMPLEDLADFVRDHRHLPNVLTSEQRERQGGIDLASFPVQLLEKIEELALYTIEQHEQIQELQARLEALESVQR